jgi:hypothetical protein
VARKKFKTVAGYLKSAGDGFYYKQEMAKLKGTVTLSEEQARREILNNLLPQIGIKDQIGPAEKPVDAVERMRKAPENEKQAKNLDTCLQWLGRCLGPRLIARGATIWKITRAGEDFTEEEFNAINKLASESGVGFDQAKEVYRAGRRAAKSYHVCGFRRDDTKTNVCMIVDSDYLMRGGDSPPHTIAEKIAGPEYCFHACCNIFQAVPDHVKNRLFVSAEGLEELYTAVPELNPRRPRRAARRRA